MRVYIQSDPIGNMTLRVIDYDTGKVVESGFIPDYKAVKAWCEGRGYIVLDDP